MNKDTAIAREEAVQRQQPSLQYCIICFHYFSFEWKTFSLSIYMILYFLPVHVENLLEYENKTQRLMCIKLPFTLTLTSPAFPTNTVQGHHVCSLLSNSVLHYRPLLRVTRALHQ